MKDLSNYFRGITMKRSEMNIIITEGCEFFEKMSFKLPKWADWSIDDWKANYTRCSEIFDNYLGWDICDFGRNKFYEQGLLLFTIRNGNLEKDKKTYAEKIMMIREEQLTLYHFHWNKMEDIINRGGGNLMMKIHVSDDKGGFSNKDVIVKIDGVDTLCKPGELLRLEPGQSICLEPYVYHSFWAEKGMGTVLTGEVSMVNDDETDNRFYEKVGRFPDIDEDEEPVRLLVTDYKKYVI